MERIVESADRSPAEPLPRAASASIAARIDRRSLAYGLGAGAGFLCLGIACIALSRFDAMLASVWLPNAAAIALLLLARLRNEAPAIAGIAAASLVANVVTGVPFASAAIFTLGNLANILVVTWLTRRACGNHPDLTDLSHLGHFLQYGGVVGPLVGAAIGAGIGALVEPDLGLVWTGASAWFLADSMGMMLVVPACLLIAEGIRRPALALRGDYLECAVLLTGGLVAVTLVFAQGTYPLLFLVPPLTLLMALRLGGLGTALFLPGIAVIACVMTVHGFGPMVQPGLSDVTRINLVQAFLAANFLTGLPVAAILARRERMTEELARGRRELALLTEGITDAVLMIDLAGVCTYASPSVRAVLGRPPEDFLGQPIAERTHPEARARIEAVVDNLIAGRSEKERLTYRRLLDDEEGNPVFIEADCAIVEDGRTGGRSGIVVSARDVTERVELELLLTRARRSAEKAASAKSEFLANMSHEIRTPMNGVLGFAELMREGDLSEENRRHAEMIVQSGRSMMMLLNDILDLSKIEAGQIGIAREPVDLFATVADCASLHRPGAEKKGLALNLAMSGPAGHDDAPQGAAKADLWIETDGQRLRQIVLNLVGNAVKFTEVGQVDIAVRADAEEVTIEVSDTGIGIESRRLQAIFAPFTQGEGDIARRFGGTGLGLSISRHLAELLGGTIDVRSEVGAGSTFRLTLPAAYTDALPDEALEGEMLDPVSLPHPASILLVEDHDVNRLLVTEMLERCGQSVAIAQDGNEAIAMVIDSVMRNRPYDLVLMDVQMPGCDGYAATRAIRAEGIGPDTLPIIALTANAFHEDIVAAREAGMQAHLAKPLVFADLARALSRWLPTRIIENAERGEQGGSVGENEGGSDAPYAAAIVDISRNRFARPPQIRDPARLSQEAETLARSTSGLTAMHSPDLLARWSERRSEAVEAVRRALEQGRLGCEGDGDEWDCIARLVHKLAGTAAIFGEPELGDQAAALEHALRTRLPAEVCEALAFELLSVADDPADTLASAGG
jgi:PAS domain S-box-containing protein